MFFILILNDSINRFSHSYYDLLILNFLIDIFLILNKSLVKQMMRLDRKYLTFQSELSDLYFQLKGIF